MVNQPNCLHQQHLACLTHLELEVGETSQKLIGDNELEVQSDGDLAITQVEDDYVFALTKIETASGPDLKRVVVPINGSIYASADGKTFYGSGAGDDYYGP